jgi:hypothetical protein
LSLWYLQIPVYKGRKYGGDEVLKGGDDSSREYIRALVETFVFEAFCKLYIVQLIPECIYRLAAEDWDDGERNGESDYKGYRSLGRPLKGS